MKNVIKDRQFIVKKFKFQGLVTNQWIAQAKRTFDDGAGYKGENPLYFFENNEWALGVSIPLNYGWWYMNFQGRKEMDEREERRERLEEWEKTIPMTQLLNIGKN